ncbi:hypothetical protein [Stutzerimonas nitrititolerans]|uniref:hypothetical protein n=1 Tax=Stutzerimonas nitrititolerans TaxID=2482751 RepID=UPI0028AAF688|nr:hypothetical protein [Stutzerimonas nitrititolerans]
MPLPPYSSGVFWKNYQIDTPTFQLSPVEKPDMSPFLFHMTGRNELVSILSGKNRDLPGGNGFLKACIPEKENGKYNAEVVCFTESPTFALDFFRYRSYRRWTGDQRFGIGFDKSLLVNAGVRPCIYADESLKKDIIHIYNRIQQLDDLGTDIFNRLQSLLNNIYPLTTPLLELEPSQGFMWEREWRYSDPESGGLAFPHSLIQIICCPESEESEIREILSGKSNQITFVRSWQEYNEVTSYLKKRQTNLHIPQAEGYDNNKEFLSILEEQLNGHRSLLYKITAHEEFTEAIAQRKSSLEEGKADLEANINKLEREIERLKNKL